jgi:Flp pilus assembly protein TadD
MRTPALFVLALVTACTTTPPPRQPLLTEHELLFGAAAVEPSDPPVVLSSDEAFGLDDGMRAFVATHVYKKAPHERLAQLLGAMKERGLASLAYDDGITQTARATFYAGSANCLSFTMLFVALAREAGLRVTYQEVDVPPTWSKNAEVVVVRSHINALVNTRSGTDYIIDFNLEDFRETYSRRRVRDEYAQSLFYNNLAAEALVRRDYDSSFRYLRQALHLDAGSTAAWSNLGLWYLRMGHHDYAESAYLQAADKDANDPTVLTNLTALYATLGRQDVVDAYRQRIRAYQQRNPYFHFAMAQAAYEQRRFDAALTAVRQAVRLKADDYEFHRLRGLVYLEMGKRAAAEQSFARAIMLGAPRDVGAAPAVPIDDLAARDEGP